MGPTPGPRRVRFVVRGRVQGVGFRALAQAEARRLGLAGYVQNRGDGAVEGEAEGPAEAVGSFLVWLRSGPPWSRVDGVETTDLAPGGADPGFAIRR